MNKALPNRPAPADAREPEADRQEPLEELRQLILGPEQAQLDRLQARLDDRERQVKETGRILPEAVALSQSQGKQFAAALAPTVEETIRISVKKDSGIFADALFPIMGPAIRKSISEAFRQMIQSLNEALERSFSVQGLKWRLESMRTGKPFAEIVLLRSLIFRVEQVFLIHRETGILLQHVSANSEEEQDADLICGMLSAIQEFVHDSFQMNKDQTLDGIQVGDFSVWVAQGARAILAAAIRGNPPEALRVDLHESLEGIHREASGLLDAFTGDPAPFEAVRHHLVSCLQHRYRTREKKASKLLPLLLAATLIALGAWALFSYLGHLQWRDYLNRLEAEPGIVITDVANRDGRHYVSGLRDPLARKPAAILQKSGMDADSVVHRLQPYQALSPPFVLQRADAILIPPASVSLTLDEGVLKARGKASSAWLRDAGILARSLAGVTRFDASGVVNADIETLQPPAGVELTWRDGILSAAGTASHRWIRETAQKSAQIQGVLRYDASGLVDAELAELQSLKADLEQERILYPVAMTLAENAELEKLLGKIRRLLQLSAATERQALIKIVGHTDSTGTQAGNWRISWARAIYIRNYLVNQGIDPRQLIAVGSGPSDPKTEEISQLASAKNRSASFRVHLWKADNQPGSLQ